MDEKFEKLIMLAVGSVELAKDTIRDIMKDINDPKGKNKEKAKKFTQNYLKQLDKKLAKIENDIRQAIQESK